MKINLYYLWTTICNDESSFTNFEKKKILYHLVKNSKYRNQYGFLGNGQEYEQFGMTVNDNTDKTYLLQLTEFYKNGIPDRYEILITGGGEDRHYTDSGKFNELLKNFYVYFRDAEFC